MEISLLTPFLLQRLSPPHRLSRYEPVLPGYLNLQKNYAIFRVLDRVLTVVRFDIGYTYSTPRPSILQYVSSSSVFLLKTRFYVTGLFFADICSQAPLPSRCIDCENQVCGSFLSSHTKVCFSFVLSQRCNVLDYTRMRYALRD